MVDTCHPRRINPNRRIVGGLTRPCPRISPWRIEVVADGAGVNGGAGRDASSPGCILRGFLEWAAP
ncbi:MAG: hypothetical protein NUV74_05535 [Candidatus Brocadiaceae bacterium]|nr:hypothetical protein [Candidatus Brocadiaceae bacterium]